MSDKLPACTEETAEGLVAQWNPFENSPEWAVESSLPQNTVDERNKILAIIDGEYTRGCDIIGKCFFISDYVAHPVRIPDPETGELVDAARLIFPQPDGPAVTFVAMSAFKSLKKLVWAERRVPPFNPPIPVMLKQVSAGKMKRVYQFIRAEDAK